MKNIYIVSETKAKTRLKLQNVVITEEIEESHETTVPTDRKTEQTCDFVTQILIRFLFDIVIINVYIKRCVY